MTVLDDIIVNKRTEVAGLKKSNPLDRLSRDSEVRDFPGALRRKCEGNINIISEIKLRSPSGDWVKSANPVNVARLYEKSRAAAISVLTDKKYFGGDIRFIPEVRKCTTKPILRKDFIIDEYQINEAFLYGADAILLIAAILSDDEIKNFEKIAGDLEMSCLVECRTKEEVMRVNEINNEVGNEIEIYGINNRNLNDMTIDLNTTRELKKIIPKGKTVVSESGIKSREDIEFLRNSGVDAALIGKSIMLSNDIVKKIDELLSV